jgi:acyl-CoA thioester hydrolase
MPDKESTIELAQKIGEGLILNVFIFPINVRFRDFDGMGHVNNAVFFTYFAEDRLALFQEFSMDSDFSTFSFILAHISCDYLRPITLNTRLSIEIWVKEIGIKVLDWAINW